MKDVCVRSAPIVEAGKYVSPMNMNNQCESNYVIVMTDGAPSKVFPSGRRAPKSLMIQMLSLCSSATGRYIEKLHCNDDLSGELTASYLNSDSNAPEHEEKGYED